MKNPALQPLARCDDEPPRLHAGVGQRQASVVCGVAARLALSVQRLGRCRLVRCSRSQGDANVILTDKGEYNVGALIPIATAQALGVATRRVFSVLDAPSAAVCHSMT